MEQAIDDLDRAIDAAGDEWKRTAKENVRKHPRLKLSLEVITKKRGIELLDITGTRRIFPLAG